MDKLHHEHVSDTWERGSLYEQYVGRWSALFLCRLASSLLLAMAAVR
jgi:hypothetical protein